MKSKLFHLSLVMLLITSCQKNPDEITVVMNNTGTLSIQVLNEDGNSGAKADVVAYSVVVDNLPVYIDYTDDNGVCNVEKLLEGQYFYFVEAEPDGKEYEESEYFQINFHQYKNPLLLSKTSVSLCLPMEIGSDDITLKAITKTCNKKNKYLQKATSSNQTSGWCFT
ncbi:MAG: hypothetical protein B6D64_14010 [Bacteroidetes bacterium 4484_276]|nr:MAG: hypothetical protein B6D64_14010 [Bacteroidetes bacterium 4484_276]